MPIISHAHPQLRQPSPHSPIIISTTFSLSSSTPHVNAPSSLGRGSGSSVFLLQHSGELHALRTLRNADTVHFNRSLVVHRRRVRILHMARLLWELRGDDVKDAVSTWALPQRPDSGRRSSVLLWRLQQQAPHRHQATAVGHVRGGAGGWQLGPTPRTSGDVSLTSIFLRHCLRRWGRKACDKGLGLAHWFGLELCWWALEA